jgi:hypothetical protein
LGLALVVCLPGALRAATITVGDQVVVAQGLALVPIMIQRQEGDPDLMGIELALQIGDGTAGPEIGLVDLVTGTIFQDNNTGSRDKGSLPRQAFWETTTASGSVPIPSQSLLATVQILTGEATSGQFDLALTSVLGQSTVLFDEAANVVLPNGGAEITARVTFIPEPLGGPLLAMGLVFWWHTVRIKTRGRVNPSGRCSHFRGVKKRRSAGS